MVSTPEQQEKGNVNAQWWASELLAVLGQDQFVKVALRQMSGVWGGCRGPRRPSSAPESSQEGMRALAAVWGVNEGPTGPQ